MFAQCLHRFIRRQLARFRKLRPTVREFYYCSQAYKRLVHRHVAHCCVCIYIGGYIAGYIVGYIVAGGAKANTALCRCVCTRSNAHRMTMSGGRVVVVVSSSYYTQLTFIVDTQTDPLTAVSNAVSNAVVIVDGYLMFSCKVAQRRWRVRASPVQSCAN